MSRIFIVDNGDLFVCDTESSLMVVSRQDGIVNLSERRKLEGGYLSNRGRLRLRLRIDPESPKQVFVIHDKKSYLHMKKSSPDYEARKPRDDVKVKPDLDARTLVKIGDVFERTDYTRDGNPYKVATGPVTKVTKCFVTLKVEAFSDDRRYKLLLSTINNQTTPWLSIGYVGGYYLRR